MTLVYLPHTVSCSECGFSSRDIHLLASHSCDVQEFGGYCEDYPCCGHEPGDCNGLLYGSDEAIKAEVYARMDDPDFDEYYDDWDRGGYA